ncbi:MAG: YncE family protein [Anaerolineae bacterium]|nr:YncE family protein [Anaerolineae bacterium]
MQRFDATTSQALAVAEGEHQKMFANDGVRVDQNGRAKLDMSGCVLDIFRNSGLQVQGLPSESAPVCIVEFEQGTIYNRVEVETIINTEWAVITSLSTEYLVHLDPFREIIWVIVVDGVVAVEAAGERVEIGAGEQTWVRRGEPPEQPRPATRGEVGDLFPPVEELTNGVMVDNSVLVASLPEPTSTPTPPRRVPTRPTPTPTSRVQIRPTRTPTPTPTTPSLNGPLDLAVYERTGNVWVTNRLGDSVAEVDGRDPDRVLAVIPGIAGPHDIAIWQEAGLAYVTNPDRNTVTEIDLGERRVREIIKIGNSPLGVAVDEKTGDVYVANPRENTVSWIVAKIHEVIGYQWEPGPLHIAYSPESGLSWVTSSSGLMQTISRGDPGGSLPAPVKGLFDLTLTPDGQGGYATSPEINHVAAWAHAGSNTIELKNAPYAIANFGRCLGVVVPAEDALYTFDFALESVLRVHRVGKQGRVGEGGQGLAYNAKADTAYVANFAANSVTAIRAPCR